AVQKCAARVRQKRGEHLRVNPGGEKNQGGARHPDKKLYLMIQQTAIIQDANNREQRGSRQDADDLSMGGSAQRDDDGQENSDVDRQPAEKRNRRQGTLARAGPAHQAEIQGQPADGYGHAERGSEGNGEGNKLTRQTRLPSDRAHRAVSMCSRISWTLSFFFDAKYQSIVRRSPSRNITCGSQPISFFARALSATRFTGPVGMSGRSLISAFRPEYSSTSRTASRTRTRSIVPRFTAVPS